MKNRSIFGLDEGKLVVSQETCNQIINLLIKEFYFNDRAKALRSADLSDQMILDDLVLPSFRLVVFKTEQ